MRPPRLKADLGWLAIGLLALLAWQVSGLDLPADRGPSRRERWTWLAMALLCMGIVTGLKSISLSSCPWDLAEFGGAQLARGAHFLSHTPWTAWICRAACAAAAAGLDQAARRSRIAPITAA
jgi:membrane-associated PAP2 superfamily phosphatase